MFRKILAAFVCAVLLFSLCACNNGAHPVEPDLPDVPDTPDAPDTPDTPDVPDTPDTPEITDASGTFVFMLERQLYCADTDGNSVRRIGDVCVTNVWQKDDNVVYITPDGTYYLDSHTLKSTKISDCGVYDIRIGKNFIVFNETASINAMPLFKAYNVKTGETKILLSDEQYTYAFCLVGDKLVYSSSDYDAEAERYTPYTACIDLTDYTEKWKVSAGATTLTYSIGRVFCNIWDGERDEWLVINMENGEMTPSDIDINPSWNVLYGAEDNIWCRYYSENDYIYRVNENGAKIFASSVEPFADVCAEVDGNLLFCFKYYEHIDEDELDFTSMTYKICKKDGTEAKFTPRGEAYALFADCSFPLMDSSTARKPVTHDIYAYFCPESGGIGSLPLCSTTHNAWLNIADGKADIALLAAPTEEEKAYLDSRGLSVDMKLYGGDGLVFIGNKDCGVTNLTLEQVRDIYSGKITNWSELGGVDHEITVLYRDDQSGSQRLFEKLLFAGMEVPDLAALGFEELGEMSTIVSSCIYNPYTIGYSIMTYLDDVYKHAELQSFALDGVAPSPETVKDESYPLHTQGYVVIRSDKAADSPARRLYNWIGSPVCDTILYNNGVTPLSE